MPMSVGRIFNCIVLLRVCSTADSWTAAECDSEVCFVVWTEKSACLGFFNNFCNFCKSKDRESLSQRQKFPCILGIVFSPRIMNQSHVRQSCCFVCVSAGKCVNCCAFNCSGVQVFLSASCARDIIHDLKCGERGCYFGHLRKTCEPMDCGNVFKLLIFLLIL